MYTAQGIRMQVLAAIVDEMNCGLKIRTLTIEPPDLPSIVDYVITGDDAVETRVQVKHSKSSWSGKDLENWLTQLKADTSHSNKRLVLIGTNSSMLAKLRNKFPEVEIPPPLPLHEGILFRALSDSIHKFAEDNKLGNPTASAIKEITHALIDKLFQASSSGKTLSGDELKSSIAAGIKQACDSGASSAREMQEMVEFKQIFGFDPPRAERDAIMGFFLLAEGKLRPWMFNDAREFLDFSGGKLQVKYKKGPVFNLVIALISLVLLWVSGCILTPLLLWAKVPEKLTLICFCVAGSLFLSMPFILMIRPYLTARKIGAVRKELDESDTK